jgi:predicted MFS family arabinose efflux permease
MPANTFRSLRHRNYRLWFFGQGFSLIGTWMQMMAQQVLVYRLTGSATALGVVSFIGFIPLLPLALWGGSIADRFPKQRVILITQIIMMLQAFVLAGLTLTGVVQIGHVYVMAFILAAAQAVDMPARQAFTVEMIEGKEDLTNAIALNSAIFNGARALGPALAGLAVATTGEGMAFAFNGLSFVAVIIGLLLMRNLPQPNGSRRTTSLAHHVTEGARFVGRQQAILVLMSLVAVSAFLSMPYTTLMPVFADRVLGESARPVVAFLCEGAHPPMRCLSPQALPLGILLTMVGIGAVTGALLVASLPDNARRGRMLTIANLAFPFLLLIFATSRSFLLSMAVLLLVGMSFVWQNSLANTLLQIITPDAVRGRVMSLYTLTFQSTMRLGGLQVGLLADRLGASLAVGLGAAISLAYSLFVALHFPKVREMA